jgi:hypothetical protein
VSARAAENEWVLLREYAGRIEADFDVGLLQEAGIPMLFKGPSAGIYGPGFAGPSAAGLRVYVREQDLVEAIELLGLPKGEDEP